MTSLQPTHRPEHIVTAPWLRCLTWLIPLMFFAVLLPLLPLTTVFRGDETLYTDAAVAMRDSSDWLTPRWIDGTPRFNKPPLTYWIAASGLSILPAGFFAARVPFLIIGVLSVLATGLLTWLSTRCQTRSVMAMLAVAACHGFHDSATSAYPDIVLTFGITLAAAGFSSLLRDDALPGSAWLAWLGTAWAVNAKGFLGLLPAIIALLFVCGPGGWARLRRLFRPGPCLAGLALSLAWFGAVLTRHGSTAWLGFADDQVGTRLQGMDPWRWLRQFAGYTVALVTYLRIWLLPLALAVWAIARARCWPRDILPGRVLGYWLGLAVVGVCIFASGNMVRSRYLLPLVPIIAAIFAHVLVSGWSTGAGTSLLHWLARTAGILAGIVACLAGVASWWLGWPWAIAGCALAITAFGVWRLPIRQPLVAAAAVAWVVLVGTAVGRGAGQASTQENPAVAWRAYVEANLPAGAPVSVAVSKVEGQPWEYAGHLRLLLHGRNPVTRGTTGALVFHLDTSGSTLCGRRLRRMNAEHVLKLWRGESLSTMQDALSAPCSVTTGD